MGWMLAPIGIAAVLVLCVGLGALTLPHGNGFERLLAGATLTVTLLVGATATLAALGIATGVTLTAALVVGAATVAVAVRRRSAPWRLPWRAGLSWPTAPLLTVATAGIALAAVAAYLLPVWQWDALGYHLPFVNLVLQHGSSAEVPADVPYLSSYPHVVEWVFTAWRALLPDDRLVDLGQLPFGLLAGLAIAAIAHRLGARPEHAVAAGAAWLTLPAVFLQLPTNYTDVAAAAFALTAIAFILSPLDRTRVLLAAIAIGLFLGAKPQSPPAAAILLGILTVLAWRAGLRRWLMFGWLAVAIIGAPGYLANLVRRHNPVWPVRLTVGPVELPGPVSLRDLLGSGANAPRPTGALPARVIESWSTLIPPTPAFDMRLGGLGPLFLIALPVAIVVVIVVIARTGAWALAACALATLVTPDPSVARYVLAFAGVVLALAVVPVGALAKGWRSLIWLLGAVLAAANLVVAYPGLTGEGPPLTAYPGMTAAQRQRAVGADGSPANYLDAVARLAPGEVTVVDSGTDLPYLAWPSDLSRAVVFAPADLDAVEADRLLAASDVRLLIVGDDTALGTAARRHPELFEPIFHCRSAPCTGYLRG